MGTAMLAVNQQCAGDSPPPPGNCLCVPGCYGADGLGVMGVRGEGEGGFPKGREMFQMKIPTAVWKLTQTVNCGN